MKTARCLPYIMLTAVLTLAIAVCALTTKGRLDSEWPVRLKLPDNLGSFHGYTILYCQNEQCQKNFNDYNLADTNVCPDCGGKLDSVALAEHRLLPKDTVILHRAYRGPDDRVFAVSVVVGGYGRRSIHKPQRCTVAQGNTITDENIVKVPLADGRKLDVMLMELNQSSQFFAYWFTDGGYETASHLSRFIRVALDGVIHNRRSRWAYISVSSVNHPGRGDREALLRFIRELYQAVSISGDSGDQPLSSRSIMQSTSTTSRPKRPSE